MTKIKAMTKKQKLVEKIKGLLKERGCTEDNKEECGIYLIDKRRSDDQWYGELEAMWLDKNGTPKCRVWYWGVNGIGHIEDLTTTNLGFVLEYLTNGYVVQ